MKQSKPMLDISSSSSLSNSSHRTCRSARSGHAAQLSAALLLGGLLAVVPQAFAQTATAAASAEVANTTQLEQVVVTSRKKREKLLDVPLSVTAVSAKTLEDAGIKNVQELTRLTPGLTINTSGAEAAVTPTIRGLTNLNGGAGDPNVAVFLDGVYLANPSAVSLGLLDMERIEIIKGPVGALYGRNAFSGVINYVSKRPSDILEGGVAVTLGTQGARTASATVSGPIKEGVLKAKLSASVDELDNTYKDKVNGLTAGGFRKKNAQASFELTPTNKLNISGGAYYGDDFFQVAAISYMTGNCGVLITSGVTTGVLKQYCGEIKQQQAVEVADLSGSGATGNKREVLATHLRANYDAPWFDVSTVLGYNKVKQERFSDFTGYRNGIPFLTTTGATVYLPETFGGRFDTDDKSVELRISSKQDQRARWAAGLYYFDGYRDTATFVGLDGSNLNGQTLASATGNLYLTSTGQYKPANVTTTLSTEKVSSEFLSGEFDITPALTATAELRHTVQDKTQQSISPTGVAGTLLTKGYGFNNYRGTLRYKLSADAMVYASAANGTKGGGFNPNAALTGTYTYEQAFKPEENTTYELGGKATFLGGKMQAGLALYSVKSSDLQISGPSDNPLITGTLVKNFGSVETKGLEFDLAVRPIRDLTINAGLGYVDAKFGNGTYDFNVADVAGCAAIPSCAGRILTITTPQGSSKAMDISGMTAPQVSKVTFNIGTQLTHPLANGWNWMGRVDYRFESKQFPKFAQGNPLGISWIGDRHLLNLRTGFDKDGLKVSFFINNVLDDKTPDSGVSNVRLNDFNGQMMAFLPAGRSGGVTVAYQY